MYCNHWGLTAKPFNNTPDPRYLYYSPDHEETLIRLLYVANEQNGALLLTGGVGCGKTLVSRVFINELNPDRYDVALVTHPNLCAAEFIKEILYQLGIETELSSKVDLIHLLNERVFEASRRGRHTIVIIDEAQLIRDPLTMEEIRLLLNFQQNDRFYITLVLMGQPELAAHVAKIPQLEQRLGVKCHIGALSRADSGDYIRHRLKLAGTTATIFSEEACELIHTASGGIPRQINTICDMALLVGFGQKLSSVSADIIEQVIQDVDQHKHITVPETKTDDKLSQY